LSQIAIFLPVRAGSPRIQPKLKIGAVQSHTLGVKAMRKHDRLSAAIAAAREQFKRPAALLLRRRHLGIGASYDGSRRDYSLDLSKIKSRPAPMGSTTRNPTRLTCLQTATRRV
jgi:hypothetical protein